MIKLWKLKYGNIEIGLNELQFYTILIVLVKIWSEVGLITDLTSESLSLGKMTWVNFQISCGTQEPLSPHPSNAVIKCIPGPHYPGYGRVLARNSSQVVGWKKSNSCSGLTTAECVKVCHDSFGSPNILRPGIHVCWDSDQRCLELWGVDLPGDLQEKCPPPPQSRAVPGAVPWTSQSTKLNLWGSPRYPGVVGGITTDRCITHS